MKFRNLLQLVFVLIAGQLLFACNSAKYYEFAAHKQAPYYEAKQKQAPAATAEETQSLTQIAMTAAEEKATTTKAEAPALEASLESKAVKLPAKLAPVAPATVENATAEKIVTEAEALDLVKERVATMTKAEKKELKNDLREALKQGGSRTSIVEIILAVLLPPLAVFLHDGIGTSFWISLILTLLFWIPGVIYALLVVTDTI
ncbi:YqaE/Pmp3 family membrane protein [Pontibacter pudoricolor]|uniref:YqaE/Pmp3 family membrane protein n=1 Tax=Pontibacter pudoricolor TaxID=2694930 RepID=UPI001EE4CB95|nr:YqaE/Pmp3 family membrane protein [Pontibacter pudoricolor]